MGRRTILGKTRVQALAGEDVPPVFVRTISSGRKSLLKDVATLRNDKTGNEGRKWQSLREAEV